MATKRDEAMKRESGNPGGGKGRRDETGKSGVYPMSGPLPEEDAPIRPMASWGQGSRGAAGYLDAGSSAMEDPAARERLRAERLPAGSPVPVCRDVTTLAQADVKLAPRLRPPRRGGAPRAPSRG
jgi:hypothetical protein